MTIACPDCGTLEELPQLTRSEVARCPICEAQLERANDRSVTAALACSVATFGLLFPANLLPLMRVDVLGIVRETYIWSSVARLGANQWVILALFTMLFAMVLPLLRFGLLSLVLGSARLGLRPSWMGRAFRWATRLDMWAMPDVFLVGCFVGYSRISASMPVTIEAGGYCFIAAAILCMITRAVMERRIVWRAIAPERDAPEDEQAISCTVCAYVMPADAEGTDCPRCGQRLRARKPDAKRRTLALVIAGYLLYIPANVYPMSSDIRLGQTTEHRIIDGIAELFHAGLWPLGILIFFTSIAVPLLKLAGMSWFLASVRRRSSRHLVARTRLYRLITEVGRWSNVDVFTVAVFVPLLQFGVINQTRVNIGSTAFLLVVVLTMIASRGFDPRLMWDEGLPDRD